MKGLVLKVKLIYFTSAWSQELLLCNFLGMRLRRTVEWFLFSAPPHPPTRPISDITINKRRQRRRPPFTKVLVALKAPEGNSWHAWGPQGPAAWEEEEVQVQRMVQSCGHKTCLTKTQHIPGFLQVCHRRGTAREKHCRTELTFLLVINIQIKKWDKYEWYFIVF